VCRLGPGRYLVNSLIKFPRLKLQNLTSNNIKLYVEDKLKKDDMMLPLLVKEPHNATQLFKNIVDKADGVFL
jgi:hypothetical protein